MNGPPNNNAATGDCAPDGFKVENPSPEKDVSTQQEDNSASNTHNVEPETIHCDVLSAERQHVSPLPRYFRLPQSGKRCPHSGLSRSTLNLLILGNHPKVKSLVVRGAKGGGGVRLICGLSFQGYILQCMSLCFQPVEVEIGGTIEKNAVNEAEVGE